MSERAPAGAPNRRTGAHVTTIAFGVLLTASLAIPAFTHAAVDRGISLVMLGVLFSSGIAELMDPQRRRLVLLARVGGLVISLLGLVVLWTPSLS